MGLTEVGVVGADMIGAEEDSAWSSTSVRQRKGAKDLQRVETATRALSRNLDMLSEVDWWV
jgi:hypothetical protein